MNLYLVEVLNVYDELYFEYDTTDSAIVKASSVGEAKALFKESVTCFSIPKNGRLKARKIGVATIRVGSPKIILESFNAG